MVLRAQLSTASSTVRLRDSPMQVTSQAVYAERNGVPVTVPLDQLWFWSSEWIAGERRASAQIAAGQVITFMSDDDFLASF